MKPTRKWPRRVLLAMILLVCVTWAAAKSSQWLFRIRAEKLFADFQTLQVNRSTPVDAQSLVRKWSRDINITTNCDGDSCRTSLSMSLMLSPPLCGQPDGGIRNLLPGIMDFLGFRNEHVGFDFTAEHGVVTQKGFGMDVALSVIEWFGWGKSYIPDLVVWSSETAKFREFEQVSPAHRFRKARHIRGAYGMLITYTPEESPAEQAELMRFRFSCLTQFFPCQNLGEILPAGWRMLQQDYPEP
jgi:hypothetical protein